MRECVLAFLRRVLAPAHGAAFLLREWDDASGRTEIWFDLAHALPSWAMPATQLPSEPGALRQHGCSYSSWQTYEAQAAAAGLVHNRSVQQAMFVVPIGQPTAIDATARPGFNMRLKPVRYTRPAVTLWPASAGRTHRHLRRQLKLKQLGDFEDLESWLDKNHPA